MSIESRYYSIFTKPPGDLQIKKCPDLEGTPSPGIFDSNTLKNYNPPVVNGVKISVKENSNLDENKIYLTFENGLLIHNIVE